MKTSGEHMDIKLECTTQTCLTEDKLHAYKINSIFKYLGNSPTT